MGGACSARGRYEVSADASDAPRPPEPSTPKNPSIKELKNRLLELGGDPSNVLERSELEEAIREAEGRRHVSSPSGSVALGSPSCYAETGGTCASGSSSAPGNPPATPKARSTRSVAELKRRLKELGLKVPMPIEKWDLEELVMEAERQAELAGAGQSPKAPRVSHPSYNARLRLAQRDSAQGAGEVELQQPGAVEQHRFGTMTLTRGPLGVTNIELDVADGGAGAAAGAPPALGDTTVTIDPAQAALADAMEAESELGATMPLADALAAAAGGGGGGGTEPGDGPPEGESSLGRTSPLAGALLQEALLSTGRPALVAALPPAEPLDVICEAVSVPTSPAASPTSQARSQCIVQGKRFRWSKGDLLGHGASGTVYKATVCDTGQLMAVKEVFVDLKRKDDAKYKAALETEIQLMEELRHPNIVAYLGNDFLDDRIYMYLEFMPGGSVAFVLETFGAFGEPLMAKYAGQLLNGLEYLHTRKPYVVHRDIKGANVLMSHDGTAKLADFGCSKREEETRSLSVEGSIPWMAPEVLANSRYGRAGDIWSFGCLMIEMADAQAPWGKFDNLMAAMIKIGMSKEMPALPAKMSASCSAFVRRCLNRDPNKRLSASELLGEPFLRPEGDADEILREALDMGVPDPVPEEEEDDVASLPDGWEKHYCNHYEEHYYWHRPSGRSMWERPTGSNDDLSDCE